MTEAINTRSASFVLGLLCACLALMQQGLTGAQNDTNSAANSWTPGSLAATSDGKTSASQLNTTGGRISTMAPVIPCYNDTVYNTTCSSSTRICYASITLASGNVSLSCRSLNATAAPVCAGSFALTSAGGAGRCEFCCTGALCNRGGKTQVWMKTACCASGQGQNQPACPSKASRAVVDVVTAAQVAVAVTVTSVVCTIVKMIS